MRVHIQAEEPASELVMGTAEALELAGQTVQINLKSPLPEAVVAFGPESASLASLVFPGVPMAVYLASRGAFPENVKCGKVLSVFPFNSFMEDRIGEFKGKTTVIMPHLRSLKMDWHHSSSSQALIIPEPFDHSSGYRTFFRALALLPGDVTAYVQGEAGDYTDIQIKRMASVEGVEERVTFIHRFSTCSVAAVVMPDLSAQSDYESAIGAMTLGIPLLLSSTGFHRELVKDGVTGLFHSPGNHRQLAGQIDHIMHNRGLSGYLSVNAAEYCRKQLSLEAVGRRWTEELEQLCSG